MLKKLCSALYSFLQKLFVSVSTFGSFNNIMRSSQANFCKSSHVTISNFALRMTLCGRVKACEIISCHSEYFWGYSHSNFLFYILRFCPCDLNVSLTQHLKYHICTLYTARCLKPATLSNWGLVFRVLLSE